ncbi:hypothetical protein [Catellatospora sp. NPDC049609]|uniref:hypothetical protein n=1 Tax=Catellatospora sp. NPDC049609 TaxID=3155505 RepID=UPI003432C5D1
MRSSPSSGRRCPHRCVRGRRNSGAPGRLRSRSAGDAAAAAMPAARPRQTGSAPTGDHGFPPGGSHGVHTDADGRGLLDDGGMYQLVREQGRVRERTLEITFAEPGAEAYAFTFG